MSGHHGSDVTTSPIRGGRLHVDANGLCKLLVGVLHVISQKVAHATTCSSFNAHDNTAVLNHSAYDQIHLKNSNGEIHLST